MINVVDLFIACLISLVASFLLTYPVKKMSIIVGAIDQPSERKIHTKVTPRLGGIAIYLSSLLGLLYVTPSHQHLPAILAGAFVIVVTGALDDRFTLSAVVKLSGQLLATSFLLSSGLIIDRITVPIFGIIDLGFFSVIITIIWVVGITNAINLIDGLDGLATGVSTIALTSIFIMSIIDSQMIVALICIVLMGANLGFLYHNFYPAKIYMGDSGSNFLGFMIAVVSMLGLFKNITFFSFVIPVIVLAVPIFDTLYAMVRRALNRENIMKADNKHVHYKLIEAGYSHRKTVLILYAFSALFGIMAILFSEASLTTSLLITMIVLLLLQILAELAGVVMDGKRPIVDSLRKIYKRNR